MNHIEWKETDSSSPTLYGYWAGAKCFSIYWPIGTVTKPTKGYMLKSMLPGFLHELPQHKSIEDAQAFAERMLQRWAAKRGLLFKSHIVVTDAMKEAAHNAAPWGSANCPISDETLEAMIKAALEARG